MTEIEQIQTEYFRIRDKYFEAREAFNNANRDYIRFGLDSMDSLIQLSEEYGYWKGKYEDFRDRYKHFITVNS